MSSDPPDEGTAPGSQGHRPVLLSEALACFETAPPGAILDATFGGGGHTRALLERFPQCHVLALDRDPTAEPRASAVAAACPTRFTFRRLNFADLDYLELPDLPPTGFAGALFDFGVSSFQLDEAERGFSFRQDAPADMRMDPDSGQSAAEFLETADREQLVHAIRDLGEERSWRRVVDAIFAARSSGKLQRTATLAELIAGALPRQPAKGRSRRHPATRAFQGIRMAVNDELGAIETGLPKAFDRLMPGGVLAAITFHSLEDRIVKRWTRRVCGQPEHRLDHRTEDQREKRAEMIHRKAVEPGEGELAENPRSRSARLRAVRKL
ncbi:MAG: 16S rRNA (cytosine(1402)-N(4))-methyltransferase RsmH [Opitutales bacterium]